MKNHIHLSSADYPFLDDVLFWNPNRVVRQVNYHPLPVSVLNNQASFDMIRCLCRKLVFDYDLSEIGIRFRLFLWCASRTPSGCLNLCWFPKSILDFEFYFLTCLSFCADKSIKGFLDSRLSSESSRILELEHSFISEHTKKLHTTLWYLCKEKQNPVKFFIINCYCLLVKVNTFYRILSTPPPKKN